MTRTLSNKELREAERRWSNVFAIRYTKLTGQNASGKEMCIFDKRYLDVFLEGASAEVEYRDASAQQLYVLLDRGRVGMLVDCSDGKPALASLEEHEQAVLFPLDCSWTAIVTEFGQPLFTYQEWIGPHRDE